MKCIIVEDEVPAQVLLGKFVDQTADLVCEGVFDMVSKIPAETLASIDLMFLDIQLPGVSGIDFLKSVPVKAKVIITTAYRDYAIEAFEEATVDYLLKPFSYERFLKAVFRAQEALKPCKHDEESDTAKDLSTGDDTLFVYADKTHHKILKSDILFLSAQGDYLSVYYGERSLLVQETMNKWDIKLNDDRFMRVHRSYMINIDKIDAVIGKHTIAIGQHRIPIARTYRKTLQERLAI